MYQQPHGKSSLPLFKDRDKKWIAKLAQNIENDMRTPTIWVNYIKTLNGRSLVDALIAKRITDDSRHMNLLTPILAQLDPYVKEGMDVHDVNTYKFPFKLYLAVALVKFYNRK